MVDLQALITELESALGLRSLAPLGQGGQKFVFTADMSGQDVVVKVVPVPAGPQGDVVRARAHREVELLAAVDSPCVVKVLTDAVELLTPLEAVTWVEERLDGEDLGQLLRSPWDEADVCTLLGDLGEGLAACHDLDVGLLKVRLTPDLWGHLVPAGRMSICLQQCCSTPQGVS